MNHKIKTYLAISTLLFVLVGCSSKTGNSLAEFNLKTLSGETITNKDLEGKTTVINVWGTWCGPCIQELPYLNDLVDRYKDDKTVVFLALAKEDKSKIIKFIKKRPFNYIQLANAESLTDELHVGVVDEIPLHIVVNKKGIITFEMTGATHEIADILSAEIGKAN